MGVKEVKKYFEEKDFSCEILELEESTATVELAAQALNVEPCLIAKTISFKTKDEDYLLIMAAGNRRVDNRKFKQTFNTRASMLDLAEVVEITGHPVGGVCPFGLKKELPIYLDVSLKNYEFVYPAAGSPKSVIKLTPAELREVTGGKWVDVCK